MAQNSIPATSLPTEALLAAYLAARYRFELAGRWWPLVVGQLAPAELVRAGPARSWSLLTAHNPQSVTRPPAVNAEANAALRAELEVCGHPVLPATASAADGGWEEPGWLASSLEDDEADALARRYGQAGILHWRAGGPVRLRMYRPRTAVTPCRNVDWVTR